MRNSKVFPKVQVQGKGCPVTAPFQYQAWSSSQYNQARQGNTMWADWEGKVETVFADDNIIYVENLKESTKKERNKKPSWNQYVVIVRLQDTRWMWKSFAFFYANNKQTEFEIKKHNSVYINIPQNEILRHKTNYIEELFEENYKAQVKKTEKNFKNGEIFHVCG